ncbi:MAG: hypothetical protein ACYTFO_02745 [Planctomycetota bacterium]|jgi:hypothetical protein
MMGFILIAIGGTLMILGTLMLLPWVEGQGRFAERGGYDARGTIQSDWLFISLYFLSLVIAPLLGGAILIVYGLDQFR